MSAKAPVKLREKPARLGECWTATELEYLSDHYGLTSDKRLASQLQRSECGIVAAVKRRLRNQRRKDNSYTAAEVSRIFHVHCRTVVNWVKFGWLKGRRSAIYAGPHQLWRFTESGIVECLRRRPWLTDFKSPSEHYFQSVVKTEWMRDRWYTTKQTAALIGVTNTASVRRYIQLGWLRAEKSSVNPQSRHKWIIRLSAIRTFLENDPRSRHKFAAMAESRVKHILAAGDPARAAVIWQIKCPSCHEKVRIVAPPQLRTSKIRERFIELYIDGHCKHGTECLIPLEPPFRRS
ncbi:hypothetical protein ES708_10298 [subsurface metagenome]